MPIKTIYLSGDHAGFNLKEKLKPWIEKQGYKIKDFGPFEYNKQDDYPDFVIPMARAIKKNKKAVGIIVAGSGIGEVIAANKFKGVRASLYHGGNNKIVSTARVHDDINVLSLGSRFVTEKETKKAISIFLKTKFSGGRHARRLGKYAMFGSSYETR